MTLFKFLVWFIIISIISAIFTFIGDAVGVDLKAGYGFVSGLIYCAIREF